MSYLTVSPLRAAVFLHLPVVCLSYVAAPWSRSGVPLAAARPAAKFGIAWEGWCLGGGPWETTDRNI
eukprot:1843258-Amphidinium_carterae.1